ncbi:MAG: type IA DNA topoisomerase [Lachnospiraceae bacterium]|nr:type IA DNA topoisomerase [Lachnospiraceae bacterium]
MGKKLYIAEKPSVAQEFAKALGVNGKRQDGYVESEDTIVTWCVGHLVTMSYPESYDPVYKKWMLNTLPFLPDHFLYEVIPGVSKQFNTVKGLLLREDVETIYVCTDSGREGEYIYRLVDEMAKVPDTKDKRRVWIDSQTEEEIRRGIREAKPLKEYDNLSDAAYLRAKEDYLMGINFSRVLSLKYGQSVNNYLGLKKWSAIAVGRVMTCVQGMVVRREREIREFVKTPFYRVLGNFELGDGGQSAPVIEGEWKAVEGSKYFESPLLYKENGFKSEETAKEMIANLQQSAVADGTNAGAMSALVEKVEKKKEKKQPPLLFNLAELQNVCSRMFKISPDETLAVTQELYEKKLVTYPRTDARVLSSAVAKEINKNIYGLRNYPIAKELAEEVIQSGSYKTIAKSKYVNDKQITDHYAIIPTGQGLQNLNGLKPVSVKVYETIVRRFLSIFFPPAVYQKVSVVAAMEDANNHTMERFFANFKTLEDEGYLKVLEYSFQKKKEKEEATEEDSSNKNVDIALVATLKKGMKLPVRELSIKEGETSPPKRYNSGSLILAMENAGQLIEDEDLRAQIKGSGIGTSATRAEILNKLVKNAYLKLNKKTQIITPTLQGEMIYDVVNASIRSLLNPELTASWEKGLTYVSEGTITEKEYMDKLEGFVRRQTDAVKQSNNQYALRPLFDKAAVYYKKGNS